MSSTHFADQVRDAQARLKYTRAEMADALGVSPHTLDSWMKVDAVSARQAPDWADAFLTVLTTGRSITYVQGEVAITYQRARDL